MVTKDPREPFSRLNVQEAKEKLDKGEAVMVDVREPGEYAEIHATGVKLVPVNAVIPKIEDIRQFSDGKEVLFICKTGARSALAAEFAVAGGLDDVELYNVEGGMVAWTKSGYPTGD